MFKAISVIAVCCIVLLGIRAQSTAAPHLSTMTLSNIEALTVDIELPEVVITCEPGFEGQCHKENLRKWVMCNEWMVHPCEFSGYQADYCSTPC